MRNRRISYVRAVQMMRGGAPYPASEVQRVLGDASPDGEHGNVWDLYRRRTLTWGSQEHYDAASQRLMEDLRARRVRGYPDGRVVGTV